MSHKFIKPQENKNYVDRRFVVHRRFVINSPVKNKIIVMKYSLFIYGLM